MIKNNLECYEGNILHCMKSYDRKPRMHQWRLLFKVTYYILIFFLAGRNVSRRSHHHILRRGGAGGNRAASPSGAAGDQAGRAIEDLAQSRNPIMFQEKV